MRRVFFVLGFLMLVVPQVYADGNTTAVTEYQVELINTSATSSKTSIIPITTVRPKVDKLTAYEVLPRNGNNSETYIGVYDDTSLTVTGERLGEKEGMSGASAGERFVRPKKIANGLVVIQGANTVVQIYFIRE